MNQIFFRILNMSIMAGLLSIVVILLRLLFKRVPKWIICLLWAIVALRLIIPFNIENPVSVVPQTVASGELIQNLTDIRDYQNSGDNSGYQDNINNTVSPSDQVTISGGNFQSDSISVTTENQHESSSATVKKTSFGSWIRNNLWITWLTGVAAMLFYALISFIRLKIKLKASIRIEHSETNRIKIYSNDYIVSPFLLGLIRPAIYIPSSLAPDDPIDEENEKKLQYVIQHETAHISRRDHIWKPLGFLLLSINWFNPLLWISYILLCRDIESACDEKVIRSMDAPARAEYSRTLLELSSTGRAIAACPVAFGETGTKNRIKAILNYKKPAFWIIFAAIVLCIAAGICLLTVRPGAGREAQLYQLYTMEQPPGIRIPHISLNTEESSFMFNWDQRREVSYREEGHYKVSGNNLTLTVEQQSATNTETGADIPAYELTDRTRSKYVFKITETGLQFLKNRSSEIPDFTDETGSSHESIPDRAVFNGIDITGIWLIEDGITILGDDEPRNENAYFLFGNLFDGEYAYGCSTSLFSYKEADTTSVNIFRYKIEEGKILFTSLEGYGSGNHPDSPAPYSIDSEGNMSFRQWGEDLRVKPTESLPWELDNAYFYSYNGPYFINVPRGRELMPKGDSFWEDRSGDEPVIYDLHMPPTLYLHDFTGDIGSFDFAYSNNSVVDSTGKGKALINNDCIVCETDNGLYAYVFDYLINDAEIHLAFNNEKSQVPNDFTNFVPDGTVFELTYVVEEDNTQPSAEEINNYPANQPGFLLNGDFYSFGPYLNVFLTYGWEIESIGSYALYSKNEGMANGAINRDLLEFTDSLFLTNDNQRIQVFLSWEDVISGIKIEECRIEAIRTFNIRSLKLNDLELAGITNRTISGYAEIVNRVLDIPSECILYEYGIPDKNEGNILRSVCLLPDNSTDIITLRMEITPLVMHGIINEVFTDSPRNEDNYITYTNDLGHKEFLPADALFYGKEPEVGDGIFIRTRTDGYNYCYQACVMTAEEYGNFLSPNWDPAESTFNYNSDSYHVSDSVTDVINAQQNDFRQANEADTERLNNEQAYFERHKLFWENIDLSMSKSVFVVNPVYADETSAEMIEEQCRYIWDETLSDIRQHLNKMSISFCQGILPNDIEDAIQAVNSEIYWASETSSYSMLSLEFTAAPLPVKDSPYVINRELNNQLSDLFNQSNVDFSKGLVNAAVRNYTDIEERDITNKYLGYACTPIYIGNTGDPNDPQLCIMPSTLEEGIEFKDGDPDSVVFVYTFIYSTR